MVTKNIVNHEREASLKKLSKNVTLMQNKRVEPRDSRVKLKKPLVMKVVWGDMPQIKTIK